MKDFGLFKLKNEKTRLLTDMCTSDYLTLSSQNCFIIKLYTLSHLDKRRYFYYSERRCCINNNLFGDIKLFFIIKTM
jgi:hypothetical protein